MGREACSIIRYFEKDQILITFIMIFCYSCSVLFLVIVNFSLCQIYKLNFIVGVYVQEETVHTGFSPTCSVRDVLGDLGCTPRE